MTGELLISLLIHSSFGLTGGHLAAMRGHLRLLQLIESRGGLLDLRDKQGRRPLEIAEANRQTAVANYLKSEMYLNSVQVGFLR